MSTIKKYALLLVGLFVVLESIAYLGISIADKKFELARRVFPDYTPEYYDPFMYTSRFAPEIGWDHPTSEATTRGGDLDIPGTRYFASAYGPSTTFCNEVSFEESWPYLFEEVSGERMVNLGVVAGAPDMEYWKCRSMYDTYPTRVVLFSVSPMTVLRLGSMARKFLAPNDNLPLIKPRYKQNKDGEIVLIPNPIVKPEDLPRIAEPEFLSSQVAAYDYWAQFYVRRYGFDIVYGRSFPYLLEVFQFARGHLLYAEKQEGYRYHTSSPASELFAIQFHCLKLFAELAEEKGFIPIFFIDCAAEDVGKEGFTSRILEFLETRNLKYFRVGPLFVSASSTEGVPISNFYAPNGHFSAEGNRRIAEGLNAFFKKEGLL